MDGVQLGVEEDGRGLDVHGANGRHQVRTVVAAGRRLKLKRFLTVPYLSVPDRFAIATGLEESAAGALLQRCDGEVKTAIVSAKADVDIDTARARLAQTRGRVRQALEVDA